MANKILKTSDGKIIKFGSKIICKKDEEELTELCFTANTAGSTVELTAYGSPSISNTAYSTDGSTWTTFTPSTTAGTNTITLTNVGDKVYFRNNITGNFSSSNYLKFVMSGSISASGNINSMYDATNFDSLTTLTYTYCYYKMFSGCASLTTAPALPATTLAVRCYAGMFQYCDSLTTAPALPATTLAEGCYYSMFQYCDSLTTAPALPATSLASYCYCSMFLSCDSLTSAPALPATELAISCYYSMFQYCDSLTTAPALPATTLASYCYRYMFSGCSSLTSAPTLPATTLASYCYYGMFYSCTSLTSAPALPATTLADYCYQYMFQNCSMLNITDSSSQAGATQFFTCAATIPTDAVTDMFTGTGGTYTGTPTANGTYYYYSYTGLCFTANTAGSTVQLMNSLGDVYGGLAIQNTAYSLDGNTWINCTWTTSGSAEYTQTITLTNVGDKVYFRNDIIGNGSGTDYIKFLLTGSIAASGNANSMYLHEGYESLTTLTYEYCFSRLFDRQSALTQAPEFPATTLSAQAYRNMLRGTSISVPPNLPATAFGSPGPYESIFEDCTNLRFSNTGSETGAVEWWTCNVSYSHDMFTGTSGSFTGTPVVGVTYYYY